MRGLLRHRFLRDNGLSLAMFGLFLAMFAGQAVAGFLVDCQERSEHHQSPLPFTSYLRSSHFAEAVFENWESEFLQMACYVVLTAILYQRGSAESRPLPEDQPAELESRSPVGYSWLYRHSLSLALFVLFVVSFGLHVVSGRARMNAENGRHGQPPLTLAEYLCSAQLWFESLQNWQSEFLSVLVLIVLSIYLRHEGSPESKAVDAPNSQTG